MANFENIPLSEIDPESSINVRKTAVEDNVEKVKRSIEREGYWQDQPIVVRPHPKEESEYKYEYVTGQCRFKACSELGLDKIPGLIEDLDDDEAIQRSWGENERRSDLKSSDQAYWAEKIYKRYQGSGYTHQEALEKAADWLGVTLQTLKQYYRWAFLPEKVKELMDKGLLANKYANAIVQNTWIQPGFSGSDSSSNRMIERAQWILGLDRKRRDLAVEALKELEATAEISDLNQNVENAVKEEKRTVEFEIPGDLYGNLVEYGRQNGIEDPATIISHILTRQLSRD